MKTKIQIMLFLIALSQFCKSQNDCDMSTATSDYFFYAGLASNFTYTGNTLTSLYLCNNALVYDTLPNCVSDRVVMIESGAKYVWKRCGAAASEIYIKTGGSLTLLPEFFPTATTVYLESGATFSSALSNSPTDTISCTQLIFPSINCATGISELSSEKLISVFPNPTNGKLSISISSNTSVDVKSFCITDSYGKKIAEGTFESASADIDTSPFEAGIYQLQISSVYGTIARKFARIE